MPPGREIAEGRSREVTAVLLAAGEGSRLGRGPKALLTVQGEPLVAALVARLRDGGCEEVVVVVGAEAEQVAAVAHRAGARTVTNPQWRSGMAASLRAGVAAADAPHLLLTLVDQPGLSAPLVARLIEEHRPGRVTAAAYRTEDGGLRRGHPVLFDRADALAAADGAAGDRGARDWLARHHERIDLVDCSDLDDGHDVDLPEDLHRLGRILSPDSERAR